jgi:hypothetical protein
MTKKPSKLRIIKIKLVDSITDKTLCWDKLRASFLPESFPDDLRVGIAGNMYTIEGAHPLHSQDFIPKGKLTLWLKKVEQ